MVIVTRALADRIAGIAQLLEADELPEEALTRLTGLGAELMPGSSVAVITADPGQPLTYAGSDARIDQLNELQFASSEGPVVETLRHNEPRRLDDTTTERRWPGFCRATVRAGFGSCLVLPLRTDQQPRGAVAFYSQDQHAFGGAAHDVALLFAAQGGTAVRNAALYKGCRQMIDNLHTALESRAVIEQAKGMLHADFGVAPEQAFQLLSRVSQNTNQKVRKVAADLVDGRIASDRFRPA